MVNTFQLNKSHTFVSGLFWQPLSGVLTEARKEARRLAAELKYDLAVWRTTSALQVGFGSYAEGLKEGWCSAAAIISKTLEVEFNIRDFLCATPLPDGRWLYVAQREGVILPDGDIIGSEEEIKSRLLDDLSLGAWGLIYASAHWDLPVESEERTFASFLPKKGDKNAHKRWWRLQPVDRFASIRQQPSKVLAPAIIVVAIVLGGAYGYKVWKNKKAEDAARLAAMQSGAAKLEHPWKTMPRASEHLKACMGAWSQVKSFWPGNWTPMEATCANGVFTVLWKRQEYGWIDHLRIAEPKAMLSGDGTSAAITIPMLPAQGEDEVVPQENARTLDIHGTAQKYRFAIVLTPAPPVAILPGQENAANQPVKDWRELKWVANGISLPPEVILSSLDGPGFRVNRIQAGFSDGKIIWNMEGVQYVQP